MDYNKQIFDGKTIADLLKEIHDNHNQKKDEIDKVIETITEHVNDVGSSITLGPIIKDYLDVGVKNDDLLIKMISIIQKSEIKLMVGANEEEFGFTKEDLEQLQKQSQDIQKELEGKGTGKLISLNG